jgi:hypothetical protein
MTNLVAHKLCDRMAVFIVFQLYGLQLRQLLYFLPRHVRFVDSENNKMTRNRGFWK